MLMFVKCFSTYSCDIDGEIFESVNLWNRLISDLAVVCTLFIVIVLWIVTKSCAVVFLSR